MSISRFLFFNNRTLGQLLKIPHFVQPNIAPAKIVGPHLGRGGGGGKNTFQSKFSPIQSILSIF